VSSEVDLAGAWASPHLIAERDVARRVNFDFNRTMRFIVLVLGMLGVVALAGCGKKSDGAAGKSGGHSHVAPHGGTLIELGDHAYSLELVRDAAAGKLTAYVLDGHAENFVRIKSPAFELIAMPGGKYTPLSLKAVANSATGETVGETSQFEVQADWLKTMGEFEGIFTIEIRGTKFEQVPFALSK
jgi:hypothetical protein